jgi:hypothetical protein
MVFSLHNTERGALIFTAPPTDSRHPCKGLRRKKGRRREARRHPSDEHKSCHDNLHTQLMEQRHDGRLY